MSDAMHYYWDTPPEERGKGIENWVKKQKQERGQTVTQEQRIAALKQLLADDDVVVIVDEDMKGCIATKFDVTPAIGFYDPEGELCWVTDGADPDELEEFQKDNPSLEEYPVILVWGDC